MLHYVKNQSKLAEYFKVTPLICRQHNSINQKVKGQMAKVKKNNWAFRIQRSELGKYSTAGISLNLPQEDLDKFSPAAIERAKELKAKHGNKYTDGYYLDYAKSLELQDIIGANNEIHKNRVGRCDIKDSNWAGYSYDEIIEMANNGYKVPEEILQWAYSQQQTDVTDYVMVSDATAAEDETTSATGAGTSELSNLQQKARQNITRTEEATKRTEQKVQEYQLTADKAKEIKKNKENSYKDSMNEINTLTKEWKKLDDKKKNGTLSIIEKKRYADLSKKLNGSDGSLMREIQVDNSDLDSFLDKLDGLNTEIDNNITIARETIQAGTDLSNYEKQYHQEQLPKMTSGVQTDGTGLLSDTLYGMKGDKIADLAIEKGSDLDEFSTNLSGELTSGDNQKLTEFAQDYTSIASKTEEETKNVMGEEFDKPTDENEEQKKNVKTYNVDIAFTYQNAQKAAITTAQATADLLSNNSSTETSNKSLKKELKKLQKDIKDITKESTEAKQTQEKNVTKEEEFLNELNTLQEQPAEQTDKKENKDTTASTDSKSGEKQAVLDEAENVHNENNTIQEKVKKALSKGVQSNTKSQKLTKVLTDNNNDLVKRNNNTQDVASKTIVVGAGTFTKSFITTAIGESMFATGISLMSNPMTYSSGLALSIAGRMLQVQGQQEFVNGIAATASGATGLIASSAANDTNTEAKTSLKDAAKIFKDNKQVFKEAAAEDTQASENPAETSGNEEITEPETETQENTENNNKEVTTADNTEKAEQEDSETTDENNTQQNKTEDKGYSVSLEFTSANSIKAAQTTNQATQDLNNNKADTDKLNTTVQSETKKSEKLVKDVDKETAQTEAKQAVNTQQSQAVTEKITTVQAQMQNASSTDEADSSQTEMQALSTQLDGTITEGEQLNTAANKSLAKSIQQLDKFHKNTQDLTKNIPDFDKKIANQLDVSQKTLGVGIGTGINGGIHTFQGTQMITEGTILMANPFTHALGVLTTAMGALTLAQGMTEITTGTVAAATGTNGIIENGKAKDSAKEAEIAEKTSKAQEKDSNKKIDETKKSLDENNEITEQPQTALENNNIEQENTEDDITAISASASTNANLNDTTTTDDKADRKLSRFNTESIIESKKKKKKVQAVLASSTNSKK